MLAMHIRLLERLCVAPPVEMLPVGLGSWRGAVADAPEDAIRVALTSPGCQEGRRQPHGFP
eukprot:1822361-Lingulodinium_polyedra.AAC.1